MNILCRDQFTLHWPVATGEYRHISSAGQFTHDACIALGQVQRHVTGNRGNAEDVEFIGTGKRQQEHDRVILTRVTVYDDLSSCH